MKVSMSIEGGRELRLKLEQLPQAVERQAVSAALRQGGEIIRANVAQRMPRSAVPHAARPFKSGAGGRRGRHGQMGASHAADHVVMAVGRSGYSLAVGPADDWWYTLFTELGTVHQPAQGKVRQAFDATSRPAQERIVQELWSAVRAAAEGGGAAPAARSVTETFL